MSNLVRQQTSGLTNTSVKWIGPSESDLHLREAARLGDRHALLDLADFNGDSTFFEAPITEPFLGDPARVAEIAARLGRDADEKRWLTIAAEGGDIESMQALDRVVRRR